MPASNACPIVSDALQAANPVASVNAMDGVRHILETIRAHLGMDVAFASEFARGRRFFRSVSAAQPECPVKVGGSDALEDSYCQRVVDGRLPELIRDAADLPEAAAMPVTRALPVGAHLSVPLRLSDGRVYGTFCCFSYEADPSLTGRDLAMLRAFAEIAANKIEAEMNAQRQRDLLVGRISDVIAHNRLMTVYQPIYAIDDGRAVGVESLARFPDCEARPPSEWFAEAVEVGLCVDLELFALRRALAGLPYLPASVYLAVNVSPALILSGELEEVIAEAPDGRLVLEITEHEAILDYVELARALGPLRSRARIAIDDVGAGYSGLRHILDLKPDIMKLDMSLTREIDRDRARLALATALAEFARETGSEIIAEGVETASELQTLRRLGISMAQGYYLSRPLPLLAAHQLLMAGNGADASEAEPEAFRNRRQFRS